VRSLDGGERAHRHHSDERHNLEYEIDGVVVKSTMSPLQREAGPRASFPRWAIAYKYAPEQAETRVRDIIVQVGRTGALTPVAELEPVSSPERRCREPRFTTKTRLRARTSRRRPVVIEKAGEIIPQVIRV
jgi:DNA ligase (NAD+)